jgi:hypothetical protein
MDADSQSTPVSAFLRLGPGSLLLASAALVAASIPYLRALALPLSALGIVVGLIGLMSNSKSSTNYRRSEMALPLAGTGTSVAVFLLAGFWLGQFEIILDRWRKSPVSEQKAVPLRSQANSSPGDQSQADWVDASQEAVQIGDVRVRLVSAAIGAVELRDSKGKKRPSEKCLILKVRVSNAGAERVVHFESWYKPASLAENPVPLLQDSRGKSYSLKFFPADAEAVGRVTHATLTPAKKVEDLLIFKELPDRVDFLRLELPASAFGSSGVVRMQIPGRMVSSR